MSSILGTAFGLAVLAAVIAFNYDDLVGMGDILQAAPVGLAISTAVHGPQIVLTALAWRRLIPASIRPSVTLMVTLRWIRESLNSLVPAGAVIGPAIAAQRLFRSGVPEDIAGATATVDVTIEASTQAVFTLLGLLLLLALHPNPGLIGPALVGVAIVSAMAAAVLIAQRNLPVRLLERAYEGTLGRWFSLKSGWLDSFQRSVWQLHAKRWVLLQAACFHMAAWSLGAVEIAGVAALLGHPISLADGMIVETLTQALRSAAFMIPGGIGLQEGGIIAACGLVGVPPDAALVLALVRRAREVLVALPGLIVWRRFGRARSTVATEDEGATLEAARSALAEER